MIKLDTIVEEIIRHVLVYNFRICCNDRAVVMVRSILVFDGFVVDRRIEYALDAILHQPFDVSVN